MVGEFLLHKTPVQVLSGCSCRLLMQWQVVLGMKTPREWTTDAMVFTVNN